VNGDAFVTEPAGATGRAMAGARVPILDQAFDSSTLYALRAAVQAHLGRFGLSEDRVNDVVLAVHELAANAIAHGAGRGRLRMWDQAGLLSCEISDTGPADPVGASGPAEVADPWPAEDGHGLWLVHQLASHLDLRSGPQGTRALVTFTLSRPAAP
jgi:anti-sigma regulatory factor (Ser/Thr protein kinase)